MRYSPPVSQGLCTTVLLAISLAACSHPTSQQSGGTSSGSTSGGKPAPPSPMVVIEAGGRTLRIPVEVARTPEERQKGLMFRRELPAHGGKIFLFDEDEVQSFWMQNTYIPLDMVFINSAMTVVGVVENAEPLTTTPRRVEEPSRYVLEVNGGFARRSGIAKGARVTFEHLR